MQFSFINPQICIRSIRICMNWQGVNFDWNQLRAFLVTAEEGSLSAAAKALKLTQPTLSRQVSGLEDALGVTLFERAGRVLVLTEAGDLLLDHARQMGEAANAVSLAASGQAEAIEGKVSITATDMASTYLLPPIIKRLSETAPGISIEVIASNEVQNLQRREADIALRNAAPSEPELITRRLRSNNAFFAAKPSYLEQFGPVETVEDLNRATWIGYTDPARMAEFMARVGLSVPPENVRYFSENSLVVWEMFRQGLGVCILIDGLRDLDPDVVHLMPDWPKIEVPFYIITHKALRSSKRIRIVWDAIVEALA